VRTHPRVSLVCCGLVGTTVGDGPGQEGAAGRLSGQESMLERSLAEAIATQGVVPGTSAYARCMTQVSRARGRSTQDILQSLFPDNPVRAQAAALAFEGSYRAAVNRNGLAVLPGANEAIDKLAGSGIRTCLTTSLSREMITLVLGTVGWRGRFHLTLSPDDGPRGFPWPDLVLTALLRLEIGSVREVAVAFSTESGVLSGRRAGAQTVAGVLTGPHTATRLRRAGATHLIDSMAELPGLLA
jgi:phosphoglycolate phosphatase